MQRCRGLEECREKLLELLDSMHPWCRSAFYADRDVARLVSALYSRWEEAGRSGEPVDYASLDELRMLLERADRYSRLPPWQALRMALEGRG